jgi:Helitron helicase-like domain at N-terminus
MENNQKILCADVYQGLVDSVAQNAADEIGQHTILSSSFSGSTCNMIQLCQDALAVNCHFKGDLFVTITVNPHVSEIQRELLPGQTVADRPDLITRVFNLKVKQFFDDVYKYKKFGNVVAHVCTTEFQNRGFLHIHVVLFLHHDHKL